MKQYRWWIALLILLLIVSLPVHAQETEPEPLVVEIGVYVVGTSEFNLDSGTYLDNAR